MSSWKDKITVQIQNREGLFILLDPQFVVSSDAKLQETLNNLGFEIIQVTNTISFRYQLEKAKKDPMKLLSIWNEDKNKIPWDILSNCEKEQTIIDCSALALFPKLTPKVVEQLDPSYYDKLNDFYEKLVTNQLTEVETIKFVLERIFGTSTKVIGNSKESFSKDLLDIHYDKKTIPVLLANYLAENIEIFFPGENLGKLLSDREYFFKFLQKEWEELVLKDKALFPFKDNNIYAILDNLFLEGYLKQIDTKLVRPAWMKLGIKDYDKTAKKQRLERSITLFEKKLSEIDKDAEHQKWQELSKDYSKIKKGCVELDHPFDHKPVQKKFHEWISSWYRFLRTMSPYHGPVMVHQILEHLVRLHNDDKQKKALLVIDGMSLTQWYVIEDVLKEQLTDFTFNTESIFAWIPTITPISRQSIFAGREPSFFDDTLLTTSQESKHWMNNWKQQSIPENQIFYSTGYHFWDNSEVEKIPYNSAKILGLVAMTVDEKIHNAHGGIKELNGEVRDWVKKGSLGNLIKTLIENDFSVFVTADHGNIVAEGIGQPRDKDSRSGEVRERRVRIYQDEKTANRIQKEMQKDGVLQTFLWPNNLISSEYHFLLPKNNLAFSNPGTPVVTHGGISLDEVMVPFVKIGGKN